MKTRGKRRENYAIAGHVKVRWHRLGDGRTLVDPRRYGRKRVTFTDHTEAVREARRIALEIYSGGAEISAMSAEERAAFAQIRTEAQRRSVSPLVAIGEWSAARDAIAAEPALDGISMTEVVRAGLAALRRPIHKTPDVVAELLAGNQRQDFDGRHARDLATQLEQFAQAFPGDLGTIQPAQVEAWIVGRKKKNGAALSPKRFNHVLGNIRHLFRFARLRGYLPDKLTAPQQVKRADVPRGAIGVFTPAEILLLLSQVEEGWLPWMAVNAFSGLRSEEIALSKHAAARKDCLRWEDFDWSEREIFVRSEVAKTGKPRRVPILPNLWAWLEPWRGNKIGGPIVDRGDKRGSLDVFKERFRRDLTRLQKRADEITDRMVNWPHNALRHSYGTYRMAELRDVQKLAGEMGDSPEMIHRHYYNAAKSRPSDAKAWFAVMPSESSKVIQWKLL